MPTKIFVNLPVRDLEAAKRFYGTLGFANNKQFTDETAASMVVSDDIYVMLLTHAKFAEFAPRPIADARATTQVLLCLSRESRGEVDALVAKAVAAGGRTYSEPKDHGFMYGHGFQDPDGHVWEVMWMDPSFVQPT